MTSGTRAYRPPPSISREDYLEDGSDAGFREAIYTFVSSVERLLKCRSVFGRILGLTSAQFAVLMGVATRQQSRGVTIKALAEHVLLASTHVTTEIGRLERKGLLVKRENETDRRSVLVSLSPKGEMAVARIAPVVRDVNDILFRDIDLRSLRKAQQVAHRIAANADPALVLLRRQRSGTGGDGLPEAPPRARTRARA